MCTLKLFLETFFYKMYTSVLLKHCTSENGSSTVYKINNMEYVISNERRDRINK